MTREVIELIAAIIGLIAVTIPLVRSFVKWAHAKGILKLVFVTVLNLLALVCYVLAVWTINRWTANVVLWLLLAFVVLAFFAFCLNTGQPSRAEIAFLVVQMAVAVALIEIGIFRPLPSTPTPASTTSSPTPVSN